MPPSSDCSSSMEMLMDALVLIFFLANVIAFGILYKRGSRFVKSYFWLGLLGFASETLGKSFMPKNASIVVYILIWVFYLVYMAHIITWIQGMIKRRIQRHKQNANGFRTMPGDPKFIPAQSGSGPIFENIIV
jgi:hypothetical protein